MSRLTGQTAAPATPEDGSIVAAQLAPNAITTAAIADNSITSAKILDGSVQNNDLAANCVNSSKIQDGSILGSDIAIETITGSNIVPGTITFNEIANNTVLGSKLQDFGITNSKMGVDSVSSSNIIDGTIQGADIANGTIALTNLAPVPNLSLIGLGVGGSPASPVSVTLGSGLSFTGNVLSASGGTSLPTFTNLAVLRGDGTNTPVTDSRLTFPATGSITVTPTGAGTVILNGNVKTPNKAMLFATVTAGAALPANTTVLTTFDLASAITRGAGVALISGNTINLARAGIYQVIFNSSVASATANARGIHGITVASGLTISGNLPTKAIKLLAGNVFVEITWVFILNVLTPGSFGINTTLNATGTLTANNTTTATSASSNIQIMEIG